MTLKQQHRTAEMTTNDIKMGWNSDSDRQKCQNNRKNTDRDMASSLIRKTTGFQIQTRDTGNPPKRVSWLIQINFMILWYKTKENFIAATTR